MGTVILGLVVAEWLMMAYDGTFSLPLDIERLSHRIPSLYDLHRNDEKGVMKRQRSFRW